MLATLALRPSDFVWTVPELQDALTRAQYVREDGEPFTVDYLDELINAHHQQGWFANRTVVSFRLEPVALRAVRQYLLAHFADEAEQLARAVEGRVSSRPKRVSPGRPRRGRRPSSNNLTLAFRTVTYQPTELSKSFTGDRETIRRFCGIVGVLPPHRAGEVGLPELARWCGITGQPAQLEDAATFLPPYPAGFLAGVPKKILVQIVLLFAERPQLFPPVTHAALWAAAESLDKDPQLQARVAMNFLPGLPPVLPLICGSVFRTYPSLPVGYGARA